MLSLSKNILKKKKESLFYEHYRNLFHETLDRLNVKDLIKISKIIESKMARKNNIFVAGNGGSASVANHFLCDFNKSV